MCWRENCWLSVVAKHRLVAGTLLLLGCGDDLKHGLLVHPLEERILRPVPVSSTISRDTTAVPVGSDVWNARRRLLDAVETLRVGTLGGVQHTVFGKIEDAHLDTRSSRLALLDSRFQEVRWFDLSGEFIGSVGKPGNGPGEFTAPRRLLFGPDAWMYVSDYPNVLEAFVFNGQQWEFERTIRLPVQINDACLAPNALYLAGATSIGASGDSLAAIHAIELPGGRELGSLGWLYRTARPQALARMSEANVACISGSGSGVVLLPEYLPEVRGYEVDGSVRWITRIAEYRPWTVAEKPDGGLRIEIPEDGGYLASGVTFLPQRFAIVQLDKYTREAWIPDRKPAALLTYVLDVESGEGLYVGSEVPRILHVDPPYFVAAVEEPFPQAVVYRMAADS